MKNKKKEIWFLVVFTMLILVGLYYNSFKKNKYREDYKLEAMGTIINYEFYTKTSYILTYKYTVKGVEYNGTEVTSFFECSNGIKGCIGESFKVNYSEKKPENSKLNLGRYSRFAKNRPSF